MSYVLNNAFIVIAGSNKHITIYYYMIINNNNNLINKQKYNKYCIRRIIK